MYVEHFSSLGSTNDKALQLAEQNCQEWTVVTADAQTKGRGRLGRDWQSLEGNLFASFVLFPRKDIKQFYQVTLLFGLAVCQSLEQLCGSGFSVKYPNDILHKGKKVAGILAQNNNSSVVVGLGVNSVAAPKLEIETQSLIHIANKEITNQDILQKIYINAQKLYAKWHEEELASILPLYKKCCQQQDSQISISDKLGKKTTAKFIDINNDGFLVVEIDNQRTILTNTELCF